MVGWGGGGGSEIIRKSERERTNEEIRGESWGVGEGKIKVGWEMDRERERS